MKIADYRHSASRGNDWYNNPSLWVYRNLMGVKTETTPRMGMGHSAEFGCAVGCHIVFVHYITHPSCGSI